MKTYLVGGAVRDGLLGKPVTDRDWVVVGATPQTMKNLGYVQVGADFPVFLHPETKEEYALARKERKVAAGHRGFTTEFSPDVTLEEDLARRDLTINAMAQAEDGALIDPFGGRRDLADGLLRAVTEAFREDPLRIFRVARFAAQLTGFRVEGSTRNMMRDMCAQGVLSELPGERVWQEFRKVLEAPLPERFFEVLEEVDAWVPFFVELRGKGPFDVGEMWLQERFAFWCERLAEAEVKRLCKNIKAPNAYRDFALQVHRYGEVLGCWMDRSAEEVAEAVGACKGFHDAEHLAPLVGYLTRKGAQDQRSLLTLIRRVNDAVSADQFAVKGRALGEALMSARAEHIAAGQRRR